MEEKVNVAPAPETQERPKNDGISKEEPIMLGPGMLVILDAR